MKSCHVFGGKTHEGLYYSHEAVGGYCVKCGALWDHIVNRVIGKNMLQEYLTISEIKEIIKAKDNCPIADNEFKLLKLLM